MVPEFVMVTPLDKLIFIALLPPADMVPEFVIVFVPVTLCMSTATVPPAFIVPEFVRLNPLQDTQ